MCDQPIKYSTEKVWVNSSTSCLISTLELPGLHALQIQSWPCHLVEQHLEEMTPPCNAEKAEGYSDSAKLPKL